MRTERSVALQDTSTTNNGSKKSGTRWEGGPTTPASYFSGGLSFLCCTSRPNYLWIRASLDGDDYRGKIKTNWTDRPQLVFMNDESSRARHRFKYSVWVYHRKRGHSYERYPLSNNNLDRQTEVIKKKKTSRNSGEAIHLVYSILIFISNKLCDDILLGQLFSSNLNDFVIRVWKSALYLTFIFLIINYYYCIFALCINLGPTKGDFHSLSYIFKAMEWRL